MGGNSQSLEGTLGLALVLAAVAIAAALVVRSNLSRQVKVLVLAGLALRVVGSFAYYWVFQSFYGGGDYVLYYERGLEYAARMNDFDFSMFVNADEWWGGRWWFTQFIFFPAGMIIAVLGPHILSGFIIFSMLAFLGLIGFGIAFHRSFPEVPIQRYLFWIVLFPSLWFWSAALGKDALLLCGLGLAAWGFVGRAGRINWLLLCLSMFLIFGVRPQVAALVAFAMVLAQWASTAQRWTVNNTLQSIALLVGGLVAIHFGMSAIGVGGIDAQGVSEYMAARSESAAHGQTNLDATGTGWASVPMAIVNILFRPAPFESASPTILLASAELWGLWVLAFLRRRNIMSALRQWRSHRLLTFALVFIIVYSAALGMLIVNLGIIARQRIFLFPFIFLLFEARPVVEMTAQALTHTARGRRLAPIRGGRAPVARPR